MISKRSRIRIRPSAWAFLVAGLLVQMAAWNTGANLLYLIAGGVFSFLLIAFLLTLNASRGLRVTRESPATAHRGDPFRVHVRIENHNRFLPALSLTVSGTADSDETAYVMKIPAKKAALVTLASRIDQRGVHVLDPVSVRTAYPFGLFERRRSFVDHREIVIYPRVHAVRAGVLQQMQGLGDTNRMRNGEGDEFFCLREYVPGDDLRKIAWRVSARVGGLVVRELEPSTSRSVYIAFDSRGLAQLEKFEDYFEDAVELVASLAVSFLNRQYAVAVIAPNSEVELGEGNGHARIILDMLARIAPAFYHEHSDNWFSPYEYFRAAGYVYVSPDPDRWGAPQGQRNARVLDPREVVRA